MASNTFRFVDPGTLAVWALLDAATGGRGAATDRVKVRFVEEVGSRGVSLLEVEHGGALSDDAELRRALFYLRFQVVGSPVVDPKRSVEQLRVVEFDGAPIGKRRRLELCESLAALLSEVPSA
jgi:hypothetical protein